MSDEKKWYQNGFWKAASVVLAISLLLLNLAQNYYINNYRLDKVEQKLNNIIKSVDANSDNNKDIQNTVNNLNSDLKLMAKNLKIMLPDHTSIFRDSK